MIIDKYNSFLCFFFLFANTFCQIIICSNLIIVKAIQVKDLSLKREVDLGKRKKMMTWDTLTII